MPINTKQNLAPVLAAQEQNITEGQLSVRDAILQAVSDFEAQNGLTLADVLADTLELRNGNTELAGDTDQLKADTASLLLNLASVAGNVGDILADVAQLPGLIADVERLKKMERVMTVPQNISAEMFYSMSVPAGLTELVNYNGRGVVRNLSCRSDCAVQVYADGVKVIDAPETGSTQYLVDEASTTRLPEIPFYENLTIVTNNASAGSWLKVYGAYFE